MTQAVSTLGSAPASLPFGPVYAMQLATGYMNVALPSNLARMAVNIRFFQRQGLSAPVAVTSGTIDSFASTVVQAVLLGVLLLFSESSLALELPFPSGGSRTLLWIVAGLVLASAVVLVVIRRFREAIVTNVRGWWPEVRSALRGLRASNKRALLVLGSLATEVLFATALGLFARSLGYDLSLAELLVINMSVSLLGSLVPVPGNIGVAEFGLTIGLVSAGMTDESALAAVLLYRIATYYLPPLWGFFACSGCSETVSCDELALRLHRPAARRNPRPGARDGRLRALPVERRGSYWDPAEAVDLYTRQSSLRISARDLSVMGATLADGGVNPVSGQRVIDAETCRFTLAVMTTAGLYETSGDWLYDVGLPGKSGIGGGIVTVAPGKGGLGTFAPLLDDAGNSVKGQLAARFLAQSAGLDIFASAPER